MKFRTNKIIEKNKKGKKGVGLGLVYPSAEAIEIIVKLSTRKNPNRVGCFSLVSSVIGKRLHIRERKYELDDAVTQRRRWVVPSGASGFRPRLSAT